MTCSGNGAEDGLDFRSWCDPCKIDDRTRAQHFVEVTNRKSVEREVTVRGRINSRTRRARFLGSSVKSAVLWEETQDVAAHFSQPSQVYVRLFGGTHVTKEYSAPAGAEYISIEIEYRNRWPDQAPTKTLSTAKADFTIQVD